MEAPAVLRLVTLRLRKHSGERDVTWRNCDRIIFSVHVDSSHYAVCQWALDTRQLLYVDSMSNRDTEVLNLASAFIKNHVTEHATQCFNPGPLSHRLLNFLAQRGDTQPWALRNTLLDVPQQPPTNKTDCGVYACAFMSVLSSGVGIPSRFLPENMPHDVWVKAMRDKICVECCEGTILDGQKRLATDGRPYLTGDTFAEINNF